MELLIKIFEWLVKAFKPIVIILALLFTAVVVIGMHYLKVLELPTLSGGTGLDEVSWAERQAIVNSKPYAMLSIVQYIQIEDLQIRNNPTRKATFRNYYTLKILRDIMKEESVFQEVYTTNHDISIEVWPGSERTDSDGIQRGKYNIFFEAKKGDVRTIVTGSTFTYDFPLTPDNETCFGSIDLQPNQWVWCYPNDEDYIDELAIIIEGNNVKLTTDSRDVFFRDASHRLSRLDPIVNKLRGSDQYAIKAYKTKLTPGECLALVTAWEPFR